MRHITPTFYVAEQLTLEQIPELAKEGVQHIICNRPDNEGENQANSEVIQQAAERHGMSFHYLATEPGQFDSSLVSQFGDLVGQLEGKTLAYCRTGTRSLSLWTLANPESKSRGDLLLLAEQAGYNMSGLIERVADVEG
ncbi:TIGR01244 family sulfur transferase [Marinomonas gallaica]|uniref:TIGR01244 family sulfur transferase n=1 Tax=Marinomonas gallaica TaxID=1806667 RepID=UPI000831498C|nr:TIGR01244 family sulfur transferase [Marinomonas gallaica]